MFNGYPFPTDPARQGRAAHFAALRAIAEAESVNLKAAGDAAETIARNGVGLHRDDPTFLDFLSKTRAADENIAVALRRHQSAWNAFFDAVLGEDAP